MNSLYQQYGQQFRPSVPNLQQAPVDFLTAAMQQAKNIMSSIQNPQQYVLQSLSGMGIQIPVEIQNDPNQIKNYLINNYALNPIQRQILGI